MVVGFSVYKLILLKGNNPSFYPILYIYGGSFIIMLINYFLAKRYLIAATLFCAVNTLNFFISTTELTWIVNKNIGDLDGEYT